VPLPKPVYNVQPSAFERATAGGSLEASQALHFDCLKANIPIVNVRGLPIEEENVRKAVRPTLVLHEFRTAKGVLLYAK
jgi:hypothetical protein